jgi:hypothetical protein
MSEVTNVLLTGNQSTTNYDISKIFIGGNRYRQASMKNTTGASLVLKAGTLLAKVSAIAVDTANVVGYLTPHLSTNVEGNVAVGILAQDVTIAAGATATNLNYAIAGDFDLSALVLGGSDTLATVIGGKAIREQITAETQLIGVSVNQLSALDNQ